MHNPPTHMGWVKLVSTHDGLGISQLMHTTPNDGEKWVVPWWVTMLSVKQIKLIMAFIALQCCH